MGEDNTEIVNTDKQLNNTSDKPWLWKPGQSGNPNGRPPKGHSITDTIRAMMDEKPEIKKALGAKILQMAVEGDITAIKTIWNYLDGMPLQKSEIGGTDGKSITLTVLRGADYIPATESADESSEDGVVSDQATLPSTSMAPESPKDDDSNLSSSK